MFELKKVHALVVVTAALSWLTGCGGHAARTLAMRTALDEGNPRAAITSLNEELDVKSDKDLPADIQGDNALLVLDRASIQQSLMQFGTSKKDFQAADKAIDMLDLAHNAGDSIGKYVFSDSSGRYVAPPYEKLLINTLNMINYLEDNDLEGARVEARRMTVLLRYFKDQLKSADNPIMGLGGYLAGFAFEKAGSADEALRYYDETLRFAGTNSLRGAVRALLEVSPYRTPRLSQVAKDEPLPVSLDAAGEGEILFVVGYGRVPHKIAKRLPIGLALTLFADSISPGDQEAANRLALQGLVTWINYPTLAPDQGRYDTPLVALDGRAVQVEGAVDVSSQVRAEWHKIEGQVVASAITRMIARLAVGQGIQLATGKDSIVGLLASLGTQATLSALDTPDTRSWETLPARVIVTRVRVPAGRHAVRLEARGVSRTQQVDVPAGGWKVVSLMALK